MATTYKPDDQAAGIAKDLIEYHHRHLEQARIIWLRTTTGQSRARCCNALLQHAFGLDSIGVYPAFVVIVTDVDWAKHRKSRPALIDTLLCSMTRQSNADTGKDRWSISKPDVSLFLGVVQRHGLSTTEELQVGKLIKDLPEQLALAMDGDDQDDDEDEEESADDWETVTRPDVSPEALSRIRGSVEAGAR